jgi:cysteine desulfurase/selenocysteine lyase
LTKETGAKLEYIGIDDNGELILEHLDSYLATGKVKLVTFSQMSNVLGTITNTDEIIKRCKKAGVKTLIDGAQSVPHVKVDLSKLGCDFFAFSAHKMLGPTGVGILWVRKQILETMQPFHGGGDMIREVHKYETTWNDLPYKFEAGTPNIADVIGFSAAIDYLNKIGMDNIRNHEIELTKYTLDKMAKVKGITIYGTKDISKRGGVISFNFHDVHPHDVATIIDKDGVAIRSGHHCAQVLMERLDVAATNRASFYVYNTKQDVDALIDSLNKVAELFNL